jgi:hypothetical protein
MVLALVQTIVHVLHNTLDKIVLILFVMAKVQLIQQFVLEMDTVYFQIVAFALREDILDHFAMLLFVQMSMIALRMVCVLEQIIVLVSQVGRIKTVVCFTVRELKIARFQMEIALVQINVIVAKNGLEIIVNYLFAILSVH